MSPAHLVLPMAGSGSRFARGGVTLPKPLIAIDDAPFFAWAVAGIRASAALASVTCIVQARHVAEHGIDAAIARTLPDAEIVVLDRLTGGAAETAYHGIVRVAERDRAPRAPVIVADCDVCVVVPGLDAALRNAAELGGGVLTTFPGHGNPAYSYARYDEGGRLVGTVEKIAASPHALAGCYGFANAATFLRHYDAYAADCPYAETYVSGVYERIFAAGEMVQVAPSTAHFSFGTPEELAALDRRALHAALGGRTPPVL